MYQALGEALGRESDTAPPNRQVTGERGPGQRFLRGRGAQTLEGAQPGQPHLPWASGAGVTPVLVGGGCGATVGRGQWVCGAPPPPLAHIPDRPN